MVEKIIDAEKRNSFDSPVESVKSTGHWQNFKDSFKPASLDGVDTTDMTEEEIVAMLADRHPLKRSLKNRHIQMIAVGGSIGSGLFVGVGTSFATGGPAAVIIGFLLTGVMVYCTMHSLGELAVRFPVTGSFNVHATRFLDNSWGFAIGWNYALQWLTTFPLELIAGAYVIGYWDSDDNAATRVNKCAWVALFWAVIAAINLFGVRGYGEAEFIFSMIKIIAIVGFCIFGIIVAAGGGPNHHYYGAHYWHDPGSFANGFKGVVSVFVNAAFAYAGTELTGLASAETDNPSRTLPKAIKQVFWRVLLFFVVSLTIVSMLVPYDNPNLGTTGDGKASPFVIAIESAGVSGLPSVFNVVILIGVLSVGNTSVYACSRTLAALGATGQGPKWLAYVDRQGRPLWAVLITLAFGLLGFLAATPNYEEVFNWLLAFSSLCYMFIWGSMNLVLIRVRRAMKLQNVPLSELTFKSHVGVPGAWFGVVFNAVILGLEFWISLWPIGSPPDAESFFEVYLSVIVVALFFVGHKAYCYFTKQKLSFHRARELDLYTGTRLADHAAIAAEAEEYRRFLATKPFYYRLYQTWC